MKRFLCLLSVCFLFFIGGCHEITEEQLASVNETVYDETEKVIHASNKNASEEKTNGLSSLPNVTVQKPVW